MEQGMYLKEFSSAFKETLAGHFAGVGGMIAGLVVAWQLGVFRSVPWAVALYPAVLTAKTVINGIFSGRLNTALHIGTVSPRFTGNMRTLCRMFQRITALTWATCVMMSISLTVVGSLFWRLDPASFSDILIVTVATMSLGLAHYLLTLPMTFTVFNKGLDLDSVAYPVAATVADVFITFCYALMVNLFLNFGYPGKYITITISVLPALLLLYSLHRGIREERFVKTIKISVLALALVSVVASLTGTILQSLLARLSDGGYAIRPEALFTAYPALIELVCDASLVIGSVATAKLSLGLMEPHFSGMKGSSLQILGAWGASAMVFVPVSAASLILTRGFALHSFGIMTSLLLATNAFAMIAMTLASLMLAILTFKKGLDPDHLVIPVESSLAGAITSAALFAAAFLLLHLGG